MGLFKSSDERRIERDMRIRAGLRAIERAVAKQEKMTEELAGAAQKSKQAGDGAQYHFVRNALKRSAGLKKVLQRQLLAMQNAVLIQEQARATGQFAAAMAELARDISATGGEVDLARTMADWEKAVQQAGTMDERVDLFIQSMQTAPVDGAAAGVSDAEVDELIDADVLAAQQTELAELDDLQRQIARELSPRQDG